MKTIFERSKPKTSQRTKSHEEMLEAYAKKNVPDKHRKAYVKASKGMVSPRAAIKEHCKSCVGWENPSDSIKNCTVLKCVLWTFRPFQQKKQSHA